MAASASFSVGSILGVCLLVAGCADGAPDPGFDNVGGSDGQGGTSGTSSNTTGATTGNTSSSSNGSTSASSSTSGSTAASTSASTGTGLSCNDTGPGEQNGTEATAHDLGDITDDDGDEGTVSGVVAGENDEDWYKYDGSDTFSGVVDPTRTVTSSGAVRICKFLQCTSGTADFTCPAGTTSSTSPEGRPGCCDDASFAVDFNCAGTSDDDATVYVRVDAAQNLCINYTLKYHY